MVEFIPKYSIQKNILEILSYGGIIFLCFNIIIEGNQWWLIYFLLLVCIRIIFVCNFKYYRKIIFYEDHLIIKYRFNTKIRKYSEIKDYGYSGIVFMKGNILLNYIENGGELVDIIEDLIKQEEIDQNQITNEFQYQWVKAMWFLIFLPIGIIFLTLNFEIFPLSLPIFNQYWWLETVIKVAFACFFAIGASKLFFNLGR